MWLCECVSSQSVLVTRFPLLHANTACIRKLVICPINQQCSELFKLVVIIEFTQAKPRVSVYRAERK